MTVDRVLILLSLSDFILSSIAANLFSNCSFSIISRRVEISFTTVGLFSFGETLGWPTKNWDSPSLTPRSFCYSERRFCVALFGLGVFLLELQNFLFSFIFAISYIFGYFLHIFCRFLKTDFIFLQISAKKSTFTVILFFCRQIFIFLQISVKKSLISVWKPVGFRINIRPRPGRAPWASRWSCGCPSAASPHKNKK